MKGVMRSLLVSLWFMVLTFPIMGMRVSSISNEIIWRPANIIYLGIGIFVLSFVWRALLVVRGVSTPEEADMVWLFERLDDPELRGKTIGMIVVLVSSAPLVFYLCNALVQAALGAVVEAQPDATGNVDSSAAGGYGLLLFCSLCALQEFWHPSQRS